jgi:hypothetical protein
LNGLQLRKCPEEAPRRDDNEQSDCDLRDHEQLAGLIPYNEGSAAAKAAAACLDGQASAMRPKRPLSSGFKKKYGNAPGKYRRQSR